MKKDYRLELTSKTQNFLENTLQREASGTRLCADGLHNNSGVPKNRDLMNVEPNSLPEALPQGVKFCNVVRIHSQSPGIGGSIGARGEEDHSSPT